MTNVRQFSLINANGASYNITATDAFFASPQGLGQEWNATYRQIGNSYILANSYLKQQSISGTIYLSPDNPYDKYYDFVQFCSITPLTLVYIPPFQSKNNSYKRDVFLNKITKAELDKYGYLEVGLSFNALTPWYRSISVKQIESNNDGSKWPVSWPFIWDSGGSKSLTIDSDSHMDSPVKFTIEGPAISPSWFHYVNGKLYETGKVTCDIQEGCKLIIDNTSYPYSMNIYNENEDVIQDAYQLADFSTKRFINLQYGRNIINLSTESAEDIVIRMEAHLYYGTV